MKKHIYIFGNQSYYDSLEKALIPYNITPHFICDEEKTKPNYARSVTSVVEQFEALYTPNIDVVALIGLSRGSIIRGVENVAKAIELIINRYPELRDTYIFSPSPDAAEIFTHKARMAELLKQMGLDIPQTTSLNLNEAAPPLTMPYPVVVKAPDLAGGRGMILAENDAEYQKALQDMKKDGHSEVVVSQYIDGLEISFAVLRLGNTFLRLPPCLKEGTSLDLKHPDNKVKFTGIAVYPSDIYEKIETCMTKHNIHGLLYFEAIAKAQKEKYKLYFLEGASRISGNSPIEFAALADFDFYQALARWVDIREVHFGFGHQLCIQFASYIHHGEEDIKKLSQLPWVIEAKLEDMGQLPHATNHSHRIRVSFIAKDFSTLPKRCKTLSTIFNNPDFGKQIQDVLNTYRQDHPDVLFRK